MTCQYGGKTGSMTMRRRQKTNKFIVLYAVTSLLVNIMVFLLAKDAKVSLSAVYGETLLTHVELQGIAP